VHRPAGPPDRPRIAGDADGNPITPSKDIFTPGAVRVHDLQATILHLLDIDHIRLTDVHGHLVKDLLA
jgi:hypothetical protein